MREKLIEILRKTEWDDKLHWLDLYDLVDSADSFADYLLANGVIVPPCKAGDTVYVINDWEVEKTIVSSMDIRFKNNQHVILLLANVADHHIKFKDEYGNMWKSFVFGKTVFLTREEAEAALKGGGE